MTSHKYLCVEFEGKLATLCAFLESKSLHIEIKNVLNTGNNNGSSQKVMIKIPDGVYEEIIRFHNYTINEEEGTRITKVYRLT
jgi:hypothetical protein